MITNDKPLLSICIPTYNRARYLKKNVESIICQPEFQDGTVEIIVSDNASDDDTQMLCESYASRFDNFQYFHNEKNIHDDNFPLVLSRGHGILRRLVNDNRVFYPDALSYMCGVIKRYERNKPVLFFADGSHTCKRDTGILQPQDFIKKASFVMTWIGAFSIWGDDCDGIEYDTEYSELQFWQVGKICRMLEQKNGVVLQHKCLSYTHVPSKKNFNGDMFALYHDNYFKILKPYKECGMISDELWYWLEKDQLFNSLAVWAIMWYAPF